MTDFTIDTEHPIIIPVRDNGTGQEVHLSGLLHIPEQTKGIVFFAHGSGSSHLSPRNQYIAKVLQETHFATLLFDLLTLDEEEIDEKTLEFRFDIEFLANRLIAATQWIAHNPVLHKLPRGYFGASTGGGAALVAAAQKQDQIKAVVSRGGRPDLAGKALMNVEAATLLIVGGNDPQVIELNQQAFAHLHCEKKLEIIPGATHLFEEPGKLEVVADLTTKWFKKYLT